MLEVYCGVVLIGLVGDGFMFVVDDELFEWVVYMCCLLDDGWVDVLLWMG